MDKLEKKLENSDNVEEKILKAKKNGLLMLLVYFILLAGAILTIAVNGNIIDSGNYTSLNIVFLVIGIVFAALGWIMLLGLKLLKPQESLVLTLFGKYIGTIKGEGFYYVNPFVSAVNPAANTKLGQSGDVSDGIKIFDKSNSYQSTNKKISLKVMTLNNSKQKINDYLGNPVEIGIAVMWKVNDTAKAVFNVDNYKEYLSLQTDTALRNIVRQYPYDVNPHYQIDTTGDGEPDAKTQSR